MSARTQPVTPAERCAAGMLRAYVDCTFAADDVADRPDVVSLIDDFEVGASRLGWIAGKPGGRHLTPAGRDLLARVEAEERMAIHCKACHGAGIMALKTCGECFGTGRTPPAKEPR